MGALIKLAIAEDHELVRKGLIEIIKGFGSFDISIEASDGKELFYKISASKHLPDIVITDINMPDWDGYMTLDAIKKKWPEIKVLILTLHKHEFAVIRMFRAGASGYLLKNSPPKELQKALTDIYQTGLYFSEVASSNLYHRLQHSNVIPSLSEKEIQLLKLCHTDLTYKEIAEKIHLSERSVAGYRMSLFEKFGVNSRAALVFGGIQMGVITI